MGFEPTTSRDVRSNCSQTASLLTLRHSSIDLTMNAFTDQTLLDVAGAVEALPSLCLPQIPSEPWLRLPSAT